MLYILKTYCDYADDNKTFIDMIHEWIVKIPGTDYYIKGDISSCDTVNKLCTLMDEMDEKYNTNFEDWDKIIQKTDMELIHIVPD